MENPGNQNAEVVKNGQFEGIVFDEGKLTHSSDF